ncbi:MULTISPECIES: hypothetical protein [unclassified Bradyrhizobium]|uniref:hypothetical protein n=1 Tax=unclassified Bradyrhizobium TaxID=2631580 RepID=UPI003398D2F8
MLLRTMVPKNAYSESARSRFATNDAFSDVLTGIAKLTNEIVDEQAAALPDFAAPTMETLSPDAPQSVIDLCQTMHSLQVVSDLALWWESNASAFRDAWSQLIVKTAEKDDPPPTRSIAGQLHTLEQAIEKAEPLDQLAVNLLAAAEAVEKWEAIQKHQRVREAIIEALEPLKELKHLVGAETARSITTLSGHARFSTKFARKNASCSRTHRSGARQSMSRVASNPVFRSTRYWSQTHHGCVQSYGHSSLHSRAGKGWRV